MGVSSTKGRWKREGGTPCEWKGLVRTPCEWKTLGRTLGRAAQLGFFGILLVTMATKPKVELANL